MSNAEYSEKTIRIRCTHCYGDGYKSYSSDSHGDTTIEESACHYCGGRNINRDIKKGSGYQYLKLRIKNQSAKCSYCNGTGQENYEHTGYRLVGSLPWRAGYYEKIIISKGKRPCSRCYGTLDESCSVIDKWPG